MTDGPMVCVLQVLGWILTLLGQIQVARRRRAGFATWVVANMSGLIGSSVRVGLWWHIGMYLTNVAECAWSFRAGPKTKEAACGRCS